MDRLRHDLRFALRGLFRRPGFTAVVVLTLALGIGANTAIFSVVNGVLLRPLPYDRPGEIATIWVRWPGNPQGELSQPEYWDLREQNRSFSRLAAYTDGSLTLTGSGEPERLRAGFMSADALPLLGVAPARGRAFSPDDDRPGAPVAVLLGDGLWRRRFGGDPSIVGRTLTLDDHPATIIGVMPAGFQLPTHYAGPGAEIWAPLQLDPSIDRSERGWHWVSVLARLRPGVDIGVASLEVGALARRMLETYPGEYKPAFGGFAVIAADDLVGEIRPAILLLLGAVGLLLLIACANVAGLLLARAESRQREIAVRTALGAGTSNLVRQLLTESVVLAVVGAGLGLAVAALGLRTLVALDPTSLPPLTPLRVDWTVVGFTLAVAVTTTLLFGLLPALRTLRVNLVESLREGTQQATAGAARQRVRGALVVAEVALAVVLVIGAGLMGRSLAALGRVPLGFDPEGVLTMRLALPQTRYDTPEKVVDFYRQVAERVRALPGVEAAGVVRALPLATTIGDWGLDVDGYVESPGREAKGDWQIVTDGAFEAMGARLVRGRWFTAADTTASQPVMVVNETMARTYWPNGEAIGGRVVVGGGGMNVIDKPTPVVVGIVADERHNGVTAAVKEKFFVPHSQWHLVTNGNLIRNAFVVVRLAGNPMTAAAPVRGVIRDLDPALPVSAIRPMTDVVATALATPRLTGFLLGAFAAIAAALAVVGLYGVLSYLVARRTHEIGIRMAMGADRGQVLRMIVRSGVTLAAIGVALGLAVALATGRLVRGLLYDVTANDPVTFVLVPLGLLLVAVLASLVPAWRAVRVSPLVALRSE